MLVPRRVHGRHPSCVASRTCFQYDVPGHSTQSAQGFESNKRGCMGKMSLTSTTIHNVKEWGMVINLPFSIVENPFVGYLNYIKPTTRLMIIPYHPLSFMEIMGVWSPSIYVKVYTTWKGSMAFWEWHGLPSILSLTTVVTLGFCDEFRPFGFIGPKSGSGEAKIWTPQTHRINVKIRF